MKTPNIKEWKEEFANLYHGDFKLKETDYIEFISSLLQAQKEEIIKTIKNVEKESLGRMEHDLKGRCDFGRIETCRKILKLIN